MTRRGLKFSPGRPGPNTRGLRPPRDVQAKRSAFVEETYVRVQSVAETCKLAHAALGISDTTTKRLIRSIRQRWAAEAEPERETLREHHRRGIIADLNLARGASKWSAVCSLRRLLAEVDGVLAPVQLEVETRRSPLDGLTPEQLDEVARTGKLPEPSRTPRLN